MLKPRVPRVLRETPLKLRGQKEDFIMTTPDVLSLYIPNYAMQ